MEPQATGRVPQVDIEKERERELTAIHEMGHVAAYWNFGKIHVPFIAVDDDEIGAMGWTEFAGYLPGFQPLTIEQDITISLAGGAAEIVIGGVSTDWIWMDGMCGDLMQINNKYADGGNYWECDEDSLSSEEFAAAKEIVTGYEEAIRKGAKLIVGKGKLTMSEIRKLFSSAG